MVLRYVDNPNGSVDDIAGICNEGAATWSGSCRTPSGPARSSLGSADGLVLLRSLLSVAVA